MRCVPPLGGACEVGSSSRNEGISAIDSAPASLDNASVGHLPKAFDRPRRPAEHPHLVRSGVCGPCAAKRLLERVRLQEGGHHGLAPQDVPTRDWKQTELGGVSNSWNRRGRGERRSLTILIKRRRAFEGAVQYNDVADIPCRYVLVERCVVEEELSERRDLRRVPLGGGGGFGEQRGPASSGSSAGSFWLLGRLTDAIGPYFSLAATGSLRHSSTAVLRPSSR